MSEAKSKVNEDVRVISATFTRLEFLLVILYATFGYFFACYLVEK